MILTTQTKLMKTAVENYVKTLIDEAIINAYEMDYNLTIDDVYDLHDVTIEAEDICQIDYVYATLCSMLPVVFDKAVEYLEDNSIEEDVWGRYY